MSSVVNPIANPVERLLQRAAQTPDKPYLHQPIHGQWRVFSWGEVADQARRMAAALLALGLPKGSRIALTGTNTAHWFMADFACGLAGMVGVGLYPKQAEDAVRFIAGHSEVKAVFVGPMPDADSVIGALPKDILKISLPYPGVAHCEHQWDDLVAKTAPLEKPVPRDLKDLWSLIYTSGTTGNPKGVVITGENLNFTAAGMVRMTPAVAGGERFLSYLPLAHAFERGAVEMGSVYLGAQVYFLEDLDKLAETIKYVRPTRFFGVPLVWTRIQAGILKQVPAEKLDRLINIPLLGWYVKRKIRKGLGLDQAWLRISGAAPMPLPVLKWFHKIGMDVFQGYGMTENSIYVSVNMPGENKLGSVGKPYEDSLIRIAKDGEIQNKHAGITPGYYKDDEKTKELFTADGWLHTGDVGRLDEEGYLFITGRVKEIFKTLKGKYVTPAPIEGSFASNHDVDQVCLVGSGLNQPVMIVSLTADAEKKSKEEVGKALLATMESVNAGVEAHEAIAKVIVSKQAWTIDNNMMTPTMKVRRNEIEKHFHDLIEKAEGDRKQKLIWEA
jgi:long-chain acyl-CoA synthetase